MGPIAKSQGVPKPHLHARVSFLFQASTHLNNLATLNRKSDGAGTRNVSRYLIGHMRGVAHKAQIRTASSIKHRVCKRCDGLLVAGLTSTCFIENKSREGKKPWADTLVVQCRACDYTTRYPIGQQRSKKKTKPAEKHRRQGTLKATRVLPFKTEEAQLLANGSSAKSKTGTDIHRNV